MTHFSKPGSARDLPYGLLAAAVLWASTSCVPTEADAAPPAEKPAENPSSVSSIRPDDGKHWSFQPLARPAIGEHVHARARTAVDVFLLQRLKNKGLNFSPDADNATLVRRTHLDLLGIPPAPEVVDAFETDPSPDSYERLVDRLLASPRFGEKWGRHWLDVAGYVDTIGFDTDATNILLSEGKWKFRDYVIRAFNEDKPYDCFLTEQLAGDELYDWRHAPQFTPEMKDALIATGYLRTARDMTHEDVGVIPQNFYGINHDTLEIVGTGLLGLTLNCARCHDHKFDPLPQEDYYRLMALFTPSYNPNVWRPVTPTETRNDDRALADISPAELAEVQRHNGELDKQIAAVREQLGVLKRPYEMRLQESKLAKLPEVIRTDVKAAVETPAERRTEVQKYLAGKFAGAISVSADELRAAMDEGDKVKNVAFDGQIAALESGRKKWGKIQALYEVGPPPATHLLILGSETNPGNEVQPGFLRVLSRSDAESLASASPKFKDTSGRRTAFAQWLTDRESPASALLARIMANRVWQHVFGRGIVPTSDNFGAQGQKPSHPELLEWLSSSFADEGWQVKRLIRTMILSTAYRQSSHDEEQSVAALFNDPHTVDPGNELLWRMRLRRLDAETVRDSILAVSGRLDSAAGGPPVMIQAQPDGMVSVADEKLARKADRWRRSIYLVTRRAYNLTLLTVFDQPAIATNCLRRETSAVPLQSLVMFNGAFLTEQAEILAQRVESSSPASAEGRVDALFRLALSRRPNHAEMATAKELLVDQAQRANRAGMNSHAADHHALTQLCHTVLNTSEFLYAE